MKRVIFFVFILVMSPSLYAQELNLETIEKMFLEEIQKAQSNDKDKYFLYSLAARELYAHKYYDKAVEYYEKAKGLKVSEDKTEVYVNLMAIDFAKSKSISKSRYDEAMKYFKDSKKIENKEIARYMNFINESFFQKDGAKSFKGFYGEFTKQKSIQALIEGKEYVKALSLMNPKGIEERDLVTRVKYDLLRSLTLGKKKFNLACNSSLEKYPNSVAWTISVCKGLKKYQSGVTPTKKDIESVERAAKKQKSSSFYIAKAFGDLK
ncbi:tetratricopeptide repeat protein [Halobacteriovorax marinus]|nr:hypothetical protein [Halobacteriovorax marinus]